MSRAQRPLGGQSATQAAQIGSRLQSLVAGHLQHNPAVYAVRSHVRSVKARANSPTAEWPSLDIVVFDDKDMESVVAGLASLAEVQICDGFVVHDAFGRKSIRLMADVNDPRRRDADRSPAAGGGQVDIIIKTVVESAWNEVEHLFRYDTVGPANERAREAHRADVLRLESVVEHLEGLLAVPSVHEKRDVHPLLAGHPFLLHPNPSQVWSEFALGVGTEYRLDFVVREADGSYVLVELESPRHSLFTRSGDFTAIVNHAIRQVEDWQEWIEDNLPTVQKVLPGIIAPKGLVIVGRSRDFSQRERTRLARRNSNFGGRIAIRTYDDIVAGARAFLGAMNRALDV